MKILVTGGSGFIGREVVRKLRATGHAVLAPTHAEVDLRERTSFVPFLDEHRPDSVLHLAWYAKPSDYLTASENPAWIAATVELAEEAIAAGCRRFVGAGTCLEYADLPQPRRESDPVGPVSLYAASKHAAHVGVAEICAATRVPLSWARLFHMHGPDEAPGRLLPWVAAQLRAGAEVAVTDGTQQRDHLHVVDVAAALCTVLVSDATGPVNICSGQPVSLRTVLETLGDLVGRRELLRFGARPHRPGEIMQLSGDASRLAGLGFSPRFALRDGLADAYGGGSR